VNEDVKKSHGRQKRPVRRYSVRRLHREKIPVPADSMLSAETHRGQLMVRVEPPEDER